MCYNTKDSICSLCSVAPVCLATHFHHTQHHNWYYSLAMQQGINIASCHNHPLQCSACQVSPDRQFTNLDVTKTCILLEWYSWFLCLMFWQLNGLLCMWLLCETIKWKSLIHTCFGEYNEKISCANCTHCRKWYSFAYACYNVYVHW